MVFEVSLPLSPPTGERLESFLLSTVDGDKTEDKWIFFSNVEENMFEKKIFIGVYRA